MLNGHFFEIIFGISCKNHSLISTLFSWEGKPLWNYCCWKTHEKFVKKPSLLKRSLAKKKLPSQVDEKLNKVNSIINQFLHQLPARFYAFQQYAPTSKKI